MITLPWSYFVFELIPGCFFAIWAGSVLERIGVFEYLRSLNKKKKTER